MLVLASTYSASMLRVFFFVREKRKKGELLVEFVQQASRISASTYSASMLISMLVLVSSLLRCSP